MRVRTALGAALAGGMFLGWPSSAQSQGAAGGEAVPAVHFHAGSPELLRLSLSGVGRGEVLAVATPGETVVTHESRVEIHRSGSSSGT